MAKEIVREKKEIKVEIGLNAEKLPVNLEWTAPDEQGNAKQQSCKAMLLSVFDRESAETFKIDLWTKDMQVVEMDRFFFQTLRAMADTYFKATQNAKLATDMQRFVQYFGEQTEILKRDNS